MRELMIMDVNGESFCQVVIPNTEWNFLKETYEQTTNVCSFPKIEIGNMIVYNCSKSEMEKFISEQEDEYFTFEDCDYSSNLLLEFSIILDNI